MFDTEQFILEVQARDCLWTAKEKGHAGRPKRQKAWLEIAEVLYANEWHSLTIRRRQETVDDLQKKWKHLRDYFIREKKRRKDRAPTDSGGKRRRTKFLDMLWFLEMAKEGTDEEDKIDVEEVETEGAIASPAPAIASQPREYIEIEPLCDSQPRRMVPTDADTDTDRCFLLSLQGYMGMMSETQNFQFRMQVMELVRGLVFHDPDSITSDPFSCKEEQKN